MFGDFTRALFEGKLLFARERERERKVVASVRNYSELHTFRFEVRVTIG